MLVYSVGSKQSFEMVRIIRDKILNHLVYCLNQLFKNGIFTYIRELKPYQWSSSATNEICDPNSAKSPKSKAERSEKSSNAHGQKPARGLTRMSPQPLSS